jgi:rRNA maturation endonuclease Nob1
MSIEILKVGKLPIEKKYKKECANCSTIFSFKREDTYHCAGGYNELDYYIKCPFCGKELYITTNTFDKVDTV